jgi:hypothetical protein
VICANHDATAAGQNAYGLMIFTGAGGLRHLGTLAGQQPRLGEPPNFLRTRAIRKGVVDADETFYGPVDANCCPSGRATDRWRYADGRFSVQYGTVIRPADS